MIIAIDGPAASGKGTLAKRIAEHWGLPCLDTGLLYRAVARDVVLLGFRIDDPWAALVAARTLHPAELLDPDLRTPQAGDAASIVARIPQVRTALLVYQRAFATQPGGAVLDGRDIGTVIAPEADVKLFVTATPEVRAQRRVRELLERGMPAHYDDVLLDLRARDARDTGRAAAPLAEAPDAILLDTSELTIEEAVERALRLAEDRLTAAQPRK